jgi:hypothetical protein
VLPIPPATVSFYATATAHPAGALESQPLWRALEGLESLLPAERRASGATLAAIQFTTWVDRVSPSAGRDHGKARRPHPERRPHDRSQHQARAVGTDHGGFDRGGGPILVMYLVAEQHFVEGIQLTGLGRG